jgi:hypothetical protein
LVDHLSEDDFLFELFTDFVEDQAEIKKLTVPTTTVENPRNLSLNPNK